MLLKALQLLLSGLGAAVPRLRQACDGCAKIGLRERWRGESERFVGESPDLLENLFARPVLLLALSGARLNCLLQRIDARVGMAPGVAEQLCIERLDHGAETGQL